MRKSLLNPGLAWLPLILTMHGEPDGGGGSLPLLLHAIGGAALVEPALPPPQPSQHEPRALAHHLPRPLPRPLQQESLVYTGPEQQTWYLVNSHQVTLPLFPLIYP